MSSLPGSTSSRTEEPPTITSTAALPSTPKPELALALRTPPRRSVTEATLVESPTGITPRRKGTWAPDPLQLFSGEIQEEPEEEEDLGGPSSSYPFHTPRSSDETYVEYPIVLELEVLQPSDNPRYDDIPKFVEEEVVVKPGPSAFFTKPNNLPHGWELYIHPEGKPYYFNPRMRVATHAVIPGRSDILARIDQAYAMVHTKCRELKVVLPEDQDYELVIELSSSSNVCQYYFANHLEENVFWLEPVAPAENFREDISSQVQCEQWLHEQYWRHLEYFPIHNHRILDRGPDMRVLDVLACGVVDHMSCPTSTFPFTSTESAAYIDALRGSKFANTSTSKGHRVWIVSRIWFQIVHTRIRNLHGHHSALIDRHQIIKDTPSEKFALRFLQWVSFLLLFNSPNAHHARLRNLWLEKIVYREQWKKLVDALIQEWTDTSLLATVLWTADMAFLAINDINIEAQLGSLISTALALSSIICALLQIRQHRGRTGAQSHEVAYYLDSVEGRYFGLLPLAINYSLPYALLVWSVAWFGIAIVFYSVRFWTLATGKATVLAMASMVITPILWSSIFAWNSHSEGFMPSWRNIPSMCALLGKKILPSSIGIGAGIGFKDGKGERAAIPQSESSSMTELAKKAHGGGGDSGGSNTAGDTSNTTVNSTPVADPTRTGPFSRRTWNRTWSRFSISTVDTANEVEVGGLDALGPARRT